MAAMEAENRLFRLGVRASYFNDAQLQLMMAAALKADDVLLVLSITARYEPILRAAEVANQYDAHTIAVTAPDSPLSRWQTKWCRLTSWSRRTSCRRPP